MEQSAQHWTGTNAKPFLASDLPFDILFQIAVEYLERETPAHPVETLLLVCKSWHHAASSSARRWSTFRMVSKDFKYWSRCIPRRLSRCSPKVLLDVEINVAPLALSRTGYRNTKLTLEKIIKCLTGDNWKVALRWRRFVARRCGSMLNAISFQFPTPNLQELELINFYGSSPIFPVTPSLKVFSTYNVQVPSFPDLSTAAEVSICTEGGFQEAIFKARKAVSLRIFGVGGLNYQLRGAYPLLTDLRLSKGLESGDLDGFCAPALQELQLDIAKGIEFVTVVGCEGLPLPRLRRISLDLAERVRDDSTEIYLDGLRTLLRAASNVSVLDLPTVMSQAFVLKLLTSDCEHLYQDHDVVVSTGAYEAKLGRGRQRHDIVDNFHRVGIMIPHGPWEKIYEVLRWRLPSY